MSETQRNPLEHITPELITPAWRIKSLAFLVVGWDAGFMIAAKGKVYFLWKNPSKRLNWDILFEADKQDVKAEWPRHYFGGGVRLTIDSKVYVIHFVKPNGAPPIGKADWGDLESAIANLGFIPDAIRALMLPLMAYGVYGDIKEGRRNTKAWREYLET